MQHRKIDGVDVFEVGEQQLRDWCYECHTYGWGRCIDNYADSLDAGRYALVSSHVRFGKFAGLSIVNTYVSLRSALRAAQTYICAETNIPLDARSGLYLHEYEVWHIVDDCELYDDWCALAAASLQYDADIEWALDDIALAGAPVCALCGDSWGGPWVMRGGDTSGRYWLCEDCTRGLEKSWTTIACRGCVLMSRRESDLVRLVDAYGTLRAYDEVAKTCNLLGFRDMCERRRAEYMAGLRAYARRWCGNDSARAMDEVLVRYSQMTIWSD